FRSLGPGHPHVVEVRVTPARRVLGLPGLDQLGVDVRGREVVHREIGPFPDQHRLPGARDELAPKIDADPLAAGLGTDPASGLGPGYPGHRVASVHGSWL